MVLGWVLHPEVPNPYLCIVYTGHISHPSDCPISGDVSPTEMFPSLSEEDTDVASTGSTCREANRPLPSGPHLPVSRSRMSTWWLPGSVRLFPHRSCHHSVPFRLLNPLSDATVSNFSLEPTGSIYCPSQSSSRGLNNSVRHLSAPLCSRFSIKDSVSPLLDAFRIVLFQVSFLH